MNDWPLASMTLAAIGGFLISFGLIGQHKRIRKLEAENQKLHEVLKAEQESWDAEENSWSTHLNRVIAERDAARAELAELNDLPLNKDRS